MKKNLFVLVAFSAIVLLSSTQNVLAQTSLNNKDRIEILYFHGKQRCITCNAIERLTREVIEKEFINELKSGKVKFTVIDISQEENEKIAEQYEVSWSSLFVNKWKGGKENINNMTQFGFSYAKNSPEVFKEGVKKKIKELLK